MNTNQLTIFAPKNKLMLDPRTKIIMMAFISSVAVVGGIEGAQIYPRLCVLLLPCFLFLINKQVGKACVFIIIFSLAWMGESYFAHTSIPAWNMICIMICGIITRFGPPLLMGNFLIYSVDVDELICSLERMKVTNKITIPLASMFRFFPTIREEAKYIEDAMAMRGIEKRIFFKSPIKFLEYRFIPLLSSMIKIGNELTISSVTRGLGSIKYRTSIVDLRMSGYDWFFIGISSLLVIAYVVL